MTETMLLTGVLILFSIPIIVLFVLLLILWMVDFKDFL